MCDRWRNSFECFLEDMGVKPVGLTLERKDVNGNYEPDNCSWVTMTEQARNRRNNVYMDFNGERRLVSHWARELGMKHNTFHHLTARKHMSIQDIVQEYSVAS